MSVHHLSKSLLTSIICLSFIIGIYLGPNIQILPTASLLLTIPTIIFLYRYQSNLTYFATIILGIIIGTLIIQSHINQIQNYHLLPYDQKIIITGTINFSPEIKNNNQQIIVSNLHDEQNQSYDGNLLLLASPFPPHQYGEQIQITGKISRPENFTEDFSYTGFLSLKNIYYTTYYPKIHLLPTTNSTVTTNNTLQKFLKINYYQLFFQKLYQFRNFILRQINQSLPYPQSGLLAGLILGCKNALPSSLYDQFRLAGLTHIIVVSGFNLSVFATLLLKNLRGQLPRPILLITTLIIILLFTLLTGAESSIVRAFFMSCILLIAPFLSRRNHPTIAILLAACIMISINPLILCYDAGFHLSFLATLGLIYISPILSPIFKNSFLPTVMSSTLAETISAMIPTSPYIAYSFHQISIIALISNILILPIIPITMGVGTISIIISFIPQLSSPFIAITNLILSYIIFIGQNLANIPYSSIPVSISTTQLLIISIITSLSIFIIHRRQKNK